MKSVLLIGLGRFGRHMAQKLRDLHHEVLAVDRDERRINDALPYVTNAQIGDSTNEQFIASLGVRNFDLCVVAIGDDFQSSLETTALLKEHGAPFVLSRATRDVWGKDSMAEDEYGTFLRGVERVLFDCHIPYRFVPDLDFSYEKLKGLKVLLLPNAACLSEEHMEVIRRFVENGGGLVASFRTSLYDEKGCRRPDFGLKDVLGCSFTGIVKDTRWDSYQKVRMAHPVFAGMDIERTEMIMNEEETLLCTKQKADYDMAASYVPPIYNQPPEYAWIPEEETEYPTMLTGQYGKGRVVYFSNQTDKACFTNGHEDFINTYRNAVEWAAGGNFSFTVRAPESVHISLTCDRKKGGRKVISFVNTTSGPFRPIRSLQPVYDLEVRLRGVSLKKAEILREESRIEVEEEMVQEDREIVIRIPCLQEFSAVFLDTEEGREG